MRSVAVNAGKRYDVLIGGGMLESWGEIASKLVGQCSAALISDDTVAGIYQDRVKNALSASGFSVSCFTFPAGESSKNISTLSDILEFLAESGITRGDVVVALGGGVTGDMAGFAAGVYLRGVRYIQLPTTLLAMVDSSVGGKTAIDLRAGKNLAGVFLQPETVICDTETLSTLPPETLRCGMAEAIKTGILSGGELFSLFDGKNSDNIEDIIFKCVQYKAEVVGRDEFEAGERKLLNLGHTVGHAIEKMSGYSIPHGSAVAAGTAVIARASAKLGICGRGCAEEITETLRRYELPVNTEFTAEKLAAAALSDKKRRGDSITLVLPEAIGRCVLRDVPVSSLEEIIRAGTEK